MIDAIMLTTFAQRARACGRAVLYLLLCFIIALYQRNNETQTQWAAAGEKALTHATA